MSKQGSYFRRAFPQPQGPAAAQGCFLVSETKLTIYVKETCLSPTVLIIISLLTSLCWDWIQVLDMLTELWLWGMSQPLSSPCSFATPLAWLLLTFSVLNPLPFLALQLHVTSMWQPLLSGFRCCQRGKTRGPLTAAQRHLRSFGSGQFGI